jgi:hypothetical protein
MKKKIRTDKQLLDWFYKHGFAHSLIGDDNGHWACTCDGIQNVPTGNKVGDMASSVFIEKKMWKKSPREAINAAIDDYNKVVKTNF